MSARLYRIECRDLSIKGSNLDPKDWVDGGVRRLKSQALQEARNLRSLWNEVRVIEYRRAGKIGP